MRKLLLPENFASYNFTELLRGESHARNRQWLLGMFHLQLGKSLKETADLVGVHWKTVQVWLKHVREDGLTGIYEKARPGAPRKFTQAQEAELGDYIETLMEQRAGGVVTGADIQAMVREKYAVDCTLTTIYATLHRLGLRWISCRSIHPKADLATQSAYKKSSGN